MTKAAELVERLKTFFIFDDAGKPNHPPILDEAAALITEREEQIKEMKKKDWDLENDALLRRVDELIERAERAEALMEHNSKAAHEAEDEIARLRAALERIAGYYPSKLIYSDAVQIASAALSEE